MQHWMIICLYAAVNCLGVGLSQKPPFERTTLKQFCRGSWLIRRVHNYFTFGRDLSSSHKHSKALIVITQPFMQGGRVFRPNTVRRSKVEFIICRQSKEGLPSFKAHLNGFESSKELLLKISKRESNFLREVAV